jgi:ABC-type antimicrobial peptide transport system permease subunit
MSLDPSTFAMALVLAGALGLGAGLIPALFAFRLKAVDILMR